MDAQELGGWWPEVARRLHAGLAARGVAQADIADVVQETAARALACPPDAADADALSRWAFTVAWRIVIDNSRRSRGRGASAAPEAQGGDVAGIVEHRLRWQKAVRAMAALSPADRAALASTLTVAADPADRRTAVRDAVRLHRARTRLTAMMAKLGAAAAAAWRVLRRLDDTPAAKLAIGTAVVVLATLELSRPAVMPRAEASPAPPRPPAAQSGVPTTTSTVAPLRKAPASATSAPAKPPAVGVQAPVAAPIGNSPLQTPVYAPGANVSTPMGDKKLILWYGCKGVRHLPEVCGS